ncbi:Vitamin B6 transporter, partial [Elasticomyces elasticus]
MENAQLGRTSARDVEKGAPNLVPSLERRDSPSEAAASSLGGRMKAYIRSFEHTMAYYNLEARGIQRALPEDRHDLRNLGFTQIGVLWFSINLAANNITLGMLGPAVFYLSFVDASLLAVFGMLVGCVPVAYIAIFGPLSGNRAMVFARYTMGWYPAKLVVILNIIVLLGYSMIDAVVAGQILSAVSPNGSLNVIVGIVIVSVITWGVTTFGYSVFHYYERYAWMPQLVVLCILAGVAGPHFDLTTASSGSSELTIKGDRLSFFSLCLSAAITYAGGAADFFVYYPVSSPPWKVFTVTMIGLAL